MAEQFGWGKRSGETFDAWPKDETGAPISPKLLTHCLSTDMEDVLLVNMLEAYGIPAMIAHPGDGDFGKVLLGMSGTGSNIFVPETMYAAAKALMEGEADDELQSGV